MWIWTQVFIILINFFVNIKIKLHKRKKQRPNPAKLFDYGKHRKEEITLIEQRNMTDFMSMITNLIATCSISSFIATFNKIKPHHAAEFPYNLTIFTFHLLFPNMIICGISWMYYLRLPLMRQTIFRELKYFIIKSPWQN